MISTAHSDQASSLTGRLESTTDRTGSPGGNLLLVANFAPGAGYAWWLMQRYWLELADLAEERGARAFLAYPEPGDLPGVITESSIEVVWHRFNTEGARDTIASAKLTRQLRIRNVYLTDRSFFDPAYLALRAAGVRRIINHDHTPGDRPRIEGFQGTVKSFRNRLPGLHVDHWIALSPLMRTRAIQNGCIPPHRISVVPNGIEPINRRPGAAAEVRSMFGLRAEAKVVVTVGRAHPYKRIDFAVRLAASVRDTRPDLLVTFLFIGAGPDLPRLKALACDLELEPGRFIFAGGRTDVRSILPGCDVALHPSRGEGFSLAILEYLSAGLPTLVPDVPSVAQIIQPGVTGAIYPDNDLGAARRMLLRMIDHEEERRRMGEFAAELIRNKYTLDDACLKLRSIVAEALWT